MDCDIRGFYKDKVVLLTGATGFLGKVIIEKLLRTTDVKRIYSLIRCKRGLDIQERLLSIQNEKMFDLLLKSNPKALQRICPIAGDCQQPDLGLSYADRKLLTSEVQIVIHGAATVRFNEPLHVALAINTRATRLMLQLAKEMTHLESYLHISTAFANCLIFRIEEKFYPELLNCKASEVLALSELVSDEVLDKMEPALVGSFPNTYSFTKTLAEDIIRNEAGGLPVSICRPSIVVASYKEPVPGWLDNFYGPIGITFGIGNGVLRVITLNNDTFINMVPVDYSVSMALATVWQTAKLNAQSPQDPKIYTFAASETKAIKYRDFCLRSVVLREKFPLNNMIWFPFIQVVPTKWLFPFVAFFYHILPGHIIDLGLRLAGKKPRLVKIYGKIHEGIEMLQYFMRNSFYFDMKNTDRLLESLSPEERQIFNFDMESLDWDDYFEKGLLGMRLYLAKELPTKESFESANRLLKKLRILHYTLMTTYVCLAGYLVWSLLTYIY